MAYDSVLLLDYPAPIAVARGAPTENRSEFRRLERIMMLLGGAAAGSIAGFAVAMSFGRVGLWTVILAAAPLLIVAFHLTAETLRDAMRRHAKGCTTAAVLHVAALLAWPMTSLLAPLGAANFWIAPVAAMATLILFASCWGGGTRAVYRIAAQGALVAVLAAHQGTLLILGS